ncbi:hypothetical protein LTR15_011928 [Elasticomyces elasticus]|nr:hypothetical protein LTR15_011928 [Elasticomyces elasticus]
MAIMTLYEQCDITTFSAACKMNRSHFRRLTSFSLFRSVMDAAPSVPSITPASVLCQVLYALGTEYAGVNPNNLPLTINNLFFSPTCMERSKQQAGAAKTTSRSGRRANPPSTSSKRPSALPFPHPGRTREAKVHTASRTSYAHGVYSVRCGIREISHAVTRESRERKQALQKLDEAQRVALYLQNKLECLESTISDLSQGQDVKVGMKDYDESLEKLAESVLKEASIQHAGSQRKTASATKRKRQEDYQPEIVPTAKRQQQSSD